MEVPWHSAALSFECVRLERGRLDFFQMSGGDDLGGAVETFKCLREELLRRA
jgi:hypothetical protein